MLARFQKTLLSSQEIWTDDNQSEAGKTWSACPGDTIPTVSGPSALAVHLTGTASQTASIEWRLTAGQHGRCEVGYHVVGTRTPGMNVNVPYHVGPASGYVIPSSVPPGDYTLCAVIDPADAIAETSEIDNTIRSEKLFTVEDCP